MIDLAGEIWIGKIFLTKLLDLSYLRLVFDKVIRRRKQSTDPAMKRSFPFLCAIFLFTAVPNEAGADIVTDFTGEYAAVNWISTATGGGHGSVDTSGAPSSIRLTGRAMGVEGNLDYTNTAGSAGLVSFDWSFVAADGDGPANDPFGYLLNGIFTQLTNSLGANSQSGMSSFLVEGGDFFGFRQRNEFNVISGAGSTTISNFSAPGALVGTLGPLVTVPEPSTALVVFGLIFTTLFSRKRRQIVA